MLELHTLTTVNLRHVNVRSERHGDELVPALDLELVWQTGNHSLDMLHRRLRGRLFDAELDDEFDDDDADGKLDLPVDPDFPHVAIPGLHYPLKLDAPDDVAGYVLLIDHGLGGKSDLKLHDCKVGKFRVTPIEGGSVEIMFRVSCSASIDERIAGKCSMAIGRDLSVTLEHVSTLSATADAAIAADKPSRLKRSRKGNGAGATA